MDLRQALQVGAFCAQCRYRFEEKWIVAQLRAEGRSDNPAYGVDRERLKAAAADNTRQEMNQRKEARPGPK